MKVDAHYYAVLAFCRACVVVYESVKIHQYYP